MALIRVAQQRGTAPPKGTNQMTNVAAAYIALEAAQDIASAAADATKFARNALKRSKSAKNIAAFVAADEAFTAALDAVNVAYANVDTAEVIDAVEVAKAERAAEVAAQPSFAF